MLAYISEKFIRASSMFKCESEFIESNFGDSAFSFLFGSYARGEQTPESDVDMIVVYSTPVQSRHQKIGFEGKSFDCYVFDVEALNGALHRAKISGKFALVHAVIAGHVLPGETPTSSKLREVARHIREFNFKRPKTDVIRFHTTELCGALSRERPVAEQVILAADLFKAICGILLDRTGEGICTGKQTARVLARQYPEFYPALVEAFQQAVAGDSKNLVQFAYATLEEIGGALGDGYSIPIAGIERIPLAA